jgi:hypothetical protein
VGVQPFLKPVHIPDVALQRLLLAWIQALHEPLMLLLHGPNLLLELVAILAGFAGVESAALAVFPHFTCLFAHRVGGTVAAPDLVPLLLGSIDAVALPIGVADAPVGSPRAPLLALSLSGTLASASLPAFSLRKRER